MWMSDPVDRMTLDELKKLRADWTDELDEKMGAYNLLMNLIPHLVFTDVATTNEWNAAEQQFREQAGKVNREILELETLIRGVESRIRQLESVS